MLFINTRQPLKLSLIFSTFLCLFSYDALSIEEQVNAKNNRPSTTSSSRTQPITRSNNTQVKTVNTPSSIANKELTNVQKSGTGYLRVGGGFGFVNGVSYRSQLSGNNASPVSNITPFSGGVTPSFNTEVGLNRYSLHSSFYFGLGLSLDLMMGKYNNDMLGIQGDSSFGGTDVNNMLVEAKIKLGFHVGRSEKSKVRGAMYVLLGAASQLFNVNDVVKPKFGPTAGLGFQITAKRYPIGFYAEASFPALMELSDSGASMKVTIPGHTDNLQNINAHVKGGVQKDKIFDGSNGQPQTPSNTFPDININLPDLPVDVKGSVYIPPQDVTVPIPAPVLDIVMSPKVALGIQIGY